MSGRVTIACIGCGGACGDAATIVNYYECDGRSSAIVLSPCCEGRARAHSGGGFRWDYYLPLINPGTCTDADIANVRAAIETISRICRALWRDDAESREDFAVMRLCAQEVRFTLYEPCPLSLVDRGTIHGVTDVKCPACNGTGIVFRDDARERLERAA